MLRLCGKADQKARFRAPATRRGARAGRQTGDPVLLRRVRCCYRHAHEATWRSGYAAVCKTVYPGSIPGVASTSNPFTHMMNALRLPAPVGDPPGEAKLRLGGPDRHNIVPCKMDFAAMR